MRTVREATFDTSVDQLPVHDWDVAVADEGVESDGVGGKQVEVEVEVVEVGVVVVEEGEFGDED